MKVKIVTQTDGRRRWKIEHDDVVALAEASGSDYLRMKTRLETEVAATLDPESDE